MGKPSYTATSLVSALTTGTAMCDPTAMTYCSRCMSSYTPDIQQPPWLWSHACAADITTSSTTVFNPYSALAGVSLGLEQSLSVLRNAESMHLGYTTHIRSGLEWYAASTVSEFTTSILLHGGSSVRYCWSSSRGIVDDNGESLGGLCMSTTGRCYWRRREVYAASHSDHHTEIGCGSMPALAGSVSVTMNGAGIEWATSNSSSSSTIGNWNCV